MAHFGFVSVDHQRHAAPTLAGRGVPLSPWRTVCLAALSAFGAAAAAILTYVTAVSAGY